MELEAALSAVGDFGKSQKRQYFLLCLPAVLSGFNVIANVFVASSPPARCVRTLNDTSSADDRGNSSLPFGNVTHYVGPLVSEEGGCLWSSGSGQSLISVDGIAGSNRTSALGIENSGWSTTDANSSFSVTSTDRCGSYAYDLSVLGSTVVSEWDLVCDKASYATASSTIYMAGIFAGALIFGFLADRFGRKTIFIVSTVMEACFGIAAGLAPEYYSFVIFRFVVAGTGVGKFTTAYILGMEMIGPSRRLMASIVIFYFYAAGVAITPAVAYLLRNWRHLLIAGSAPGLLFVSYYWLVHESVRWLQANRRIAEAETIIRKTAATNGVSLSDDWHLLSSNVPRTVSSTEKAAAAESASDDRKALAGGSDREPADSAPADSLLTVLKSKKLFLQSLAVALNWLVASMGYYGLTLNSGNLVGNIYLNTFITGLVEFPAYTIGFVCGKLGRKKPYVACMLLAALSSTTIVVLTFAVGEGLHGWAYVTADMVGKLGISAAFSLAFLWSAEIFPTTLRSSLMGICSTVARAGSIAAPFIADAGKMVPNRALSYCLHSIVFGALMIAAGVVALLLPETLDRPLPQTVDKARAINNGCNRTKYDLLAAPQEMAQLRNAD